MESVSGRFAIGVLAEHQRGGLRLRAVRRTRPLQLEGLGAGCDLWACDLLPARDKLGPGEALVATVSTGQTI